MRHRKLRTKAKGTSTHSRAIYSNMLKGLVDRSVAVRTALGRLRVEWPEGGEIHQIGPAEVVFTGDFPAA